MAWVPKRPSGPWPLETEAASNASWALGHQPGRLETWGHQGANPMPCWKTTVLHDSRCRELRVTGVGYRRVWLPSYGTWNN